MTAKTDHYTGVLLEDMNHRLKLIQEALDALQGVPEELRQMRERLDKVDDWSDVAKLVIKDHSKTLKKHDLRLTKLETA
jgi:hypothetical protein